MGIEKIINFGIDVIQDELTEGIWRPSQWQNPATIMITFPGQGNGTPQYSPLTGIGATLPSVLTNYVFDAVMVHFTSAGSGAPGDLSSHNPEDPARRTGPTGAPSGGGRWAFCRRAAYAGKTLCGAKRFPAVLEQHLRWPEAADPGP
jgi:hypothetical protein